MQNRQAMSKPHKLTEPGLVCQYCGSSNGCRSTGGMLTSISELDADDWRQMYWFIRYVQLPFIHQLIWRAKKREGNATSSHTAQCRDVC
jgi:hypothetical protein